MAWHQGKWQPLHFTLLKQVLKTLESCQRCLVLHIQCASEDETMRYYETHFASSCDKVDKQTSSLLFF